MWTFSKKMCNFLLNGDDDNSVNQLHDDVNTVSCMLELKPTIKLKKRSTTMRAVQQYVMQCEMECPAHVEMNQETALHLSINACI